jgi:hypothetical protein
MTVLRALLFRNRGLACLLVAMALCLNVLVPKGFMPQAQGHVLTMRICADASGADTARQVLIPLGQDGAPDQDNSPAQHRAADGLCAFAALARLAPPAVDAIALAEPPQPAAAPRALAPAAAIPARAALRLRPPLRGPPLHV